MKCSRCQRQLKSASVTSGSQSYGPRCARLVGLTPGRRVAAPVEQAGQLPLFVPEIVAS